MAIQPFQAYRAPQPQIGKKSPVTLKNAARPMTYSAPMAASLPQNKMAASPSQPQPQFGGPFATGWFVTRIVSKSALWLAMFFGAWNGINDIGTALTSPATPAVSAASDVLSDAIEQEEIARGVREPNEDTPLLSGEEARTGLYQAVLGNYEAYAQETRLTEIAGRIAEIKASLTPEERRVFDEFHQEVTAVVAPDGGNPPKWTDDDEVWSQLRPILTARGLSDGLIDAFRNNMEALQANKSLGLGSAILAIDFLVLGGMGYAAAQRARRGTPRPDKRPWLFRFPEPPKSGGDTGKK